MGIHGVTRGYPGLQGVTRGYKGLQAVTRGYRGLQRIIETFSKKNVPRYFFLVYFA